MFISTNEHLAERVFDALGVAAKAHRLLPELPENLKPLHFRVLLAMYRIRDGDGIARVSDINARLGFLLPNTAKLLKDLSDLKIVEKSVAPHDRRVVLVHATAKGETYIRDYVIPFGTELQNVFSALDESECESMIATIEKIYDAMKKVYREAGQPEGSTHL